LWRWALLPKYLELSTDIPPFSMPSALCPTLPRLGEQAYVPWLVHFSCYPVNKRLIIPLWFPKKRNIQDWKGINEISKMEQDQSQSKVETQYCLKKKKIHYFSQLWCVPIELLTLKITIHFKVYKYIRIFCATKTGIQNLLSNFKQSGKKQTNKCSINS